MTVASGQIQLVVFDLGRVLVRICDDWRHACRFAGIDVPGGSSSAQDAARLRELSHQIEIGAIDAQSFARDAAPLMGLSPAQVSGMLEAYIRGPYPGAVELLEELAAAGVRTACLSNTNSPHWEQLSRPNHRAYFPLDRLNHRFASHLLGLRKPDEAIYAEVEKRVEVPGSAIVFFDDVAENVQASQRRGWHGRWIDPLLDDPIGQARRALTELGVL